MTVPHARRAAGALLALLLALPSTSHARAAAPRRGRAAPPAVAEIARARFEPPFFGTVFGRAVRALRSDGYELVSCDADRGSLATSPREFDAPCGESTCLARQSIAVLLGYRAARVTVYREVFDPTVKAWIPAESARSRADAEDLARAIVSPPSPGADGGGGGEDPCGGGDSAPRAGDDGEGRPASAGDSPQVG